MNNLKHDANQIPMYMAANGLVANASKTVFMFLNLTKKEAESELTKEIEVGSTTVIRSDTTKLLGMEIDDQQNRNEHFNGLVSALNKRTFVIGRISNLIPKKK